MLIPFGRGLNIIFATPEMAIPQRTSILSLQAKRPYHLGFTKRGENTKLRGRSRHVESNSESLIHVLLRPHKATVKKKNSRPYPFMASSMLYMYIYSVFSYSTMVPDSWYLSVLPNRPSCFHHARM